MSIIDQIDADDYPFFEKAGDFLATPGRLFFGRSYTLERTAEGNPILKHHERHRIIGKILAIILLPFSLVATLFGISLKLFSKIFALQTREKYSYPKFINAREEENFLGKFPSNPCTPNCVNTQQKSFWGKLYNADPIAIPEDMENPLETLKHLFNTATHPNFHSEKITLIEEQGNYLHYTYTVEIPSGPLKGTYIDDIDIYYNESMHYFEIRSASRTGFRDAVNFNFKVPGANKKRIEAIRTSFQALCEHTDSYSSSLICQQN